MASSKEAELKASGIESLVEATRKISNDLIKEMTEALTGLSSCDVERGTEPFWQSSGKQRFKKLQNIYEIVKGLEHEFKIDENTAIGAFRLRQKECIGKANLSIGRFKDVQRLVKKLTKIK